MASCSVKLAGGKLAMGRRMPGRCHRGEPLRDLALPGANQQAVHTL